MNLFRSCCLSASVAAKSTRLAWIVSSLVVLATLYSAPAHLNADDRYWIDLAGGSFTDTGNWSTSFHGAGGASVPGAADRALFYASAGAVNFRGRPIVEPLTYTVNQLQVRNSTVSFADLVNLNELPATVNFTSSGSLSGRSILIREGSELNTTLAHLMGAVRQSESADAV